MLGLDGGVMSELKALLAVKKLLTWIVITDKSVHCLVYFQGVCSTQLANVGNNISF